MLSLLKRLDKFAEPVSVNYRGQEKFSTIGGACLSIIVSVVILVYALGRGDQLVNRKWPPVLTTTIEFLNYQTDATKFNLEEQDLDVLVKFEVLPTEAKEPVRSWEAINDSLGRVIAYEAKQ